MALANIPLFKKDPADSISKKFNLDIDDLSTFESVEALVYIASQGGRKDERIWTISGSDLKSSMLSFETSVSGTYPAITWRLIGGDASTYYAVIFNVNQSSSSQARYQAACIVKNVDIII